MLVKKELANQKTEWRDGPLEKWWGCWDFFSLQGLFHDLSLCRILFWGANRLHKVFWRVGVGIGGGMFYYCNLNIDICHILNTWNRLQVEPNIFFNFHSCIAFLVWCLGKYQIGFCEWPSSGKYGAQGPIKLGSDWKFCKIEAFWWVFHNVQPINLMYRLNLNDNASFILFYVAKNLK